MIRFDRKRRQACPTRENRPTGREPAFAPLFGGFLAAWFGWRAIFAFAAVYGCAVFASMLLLPETKKGPAAPINVKEIFATYKNILASKSFIIPNLVAAARVIYPPIPSARGRVDALSWSKRLRRVEGHRVSGGVRQEQERHLESAEIASIVDCPASVPTASMMMTVTTPCAINE
jgi:hypothetical protein